MIEIVLDRRTGRTAMREDARNAAVGKCINRIELSLGRELVKCHVEGDVKGLALALLGRAARSHNEGAEGEFVERPAAGTGQQPKTRPSTPALTARPRSISIMRSSSWL